MKEKIGMKETYTQPEMELLFFESEDVIVTSGEKFFEDETDRDLG